jgi:hypothetical protein
MGLKILRLKATILGIEPHIWRRLETPIWLELVGMSPCP